VSTSGELVAFNGGSLVFLAPDGRVVSSLTVPGDKVIRAVGPRRGGAGEYVRSLLERP